MTDKPNFFKALDSVFAATLAGLEMNLNDIAKMIEENKAAGCTHPNPTPSPVAEDVKDTATGTTGTDATPIFDGFRVEMTSQELNNYLYQKVEYHRRRAMDYREQASKIGTLQKEDGGPTAYANNPANTLEASAENHAERAEFYAFLRKHLVVDALYYLKPDDLMYIGVQGGRFF